MSDVKITENVRTHAYFLWKKAGEPTGKDMRFWLRAEAGYDKEPPQFFVGKTVELEHEGFIVCAKTESTDENFCQGVITEQPPEDSGLDIGDQIIYTPDEVFKVL